MNSEPLRPLIEIPDPNGPNVFDRQTCSKVWELEILGRKITIERYGVCLWYRIRFLMGDEEGQRELYRLDLAEDYETRYEFFFGQKIREYVGDQSCFVEYIELMARLKRVPTPDEAKTNLGINEKIIKKYQRIIGALRGLENEGEDFQ